MVPAHRPEDLCLYVLMRTDMDSMNPGKGHAQSAHAQKHADVLIWRKGAFGDAWKAAYEAWEAQTEQGFGVTICLGGDIGAIRGAVEILRAARFPAGITHDPSYPLRDGRVCHEIPIDTCGWAFGPRPSLEPVLGRFPLCP